MPNPNNEGLTAFAGGGDFLALHNQTLISDHVTIATTVEVMRFSSYDINTGSYITDKMERVGVADGEFIGPRLEDSSRSTYRFELDPKNTRYIIRENMHTKEKLWGFWSSEVHGLFIFNVPLKSEYFRD